MAPNSETSHDQVDFEVPRDLRTLNSEIPRDLRTLNSEGPRDLRILNSEAPRDHVESEGPHRHENDESKKLRADKPQILRSNEL